MRFWFRGLFAAFRPPGDPFALAVARLKNGDPAIAAAELTALLEAADEPGVRAQLRNKRGIAYVRLERREDAARDFAAALDEDPAFAPALANFGNLLFEEGAVDDAIVYYEAAIRADETYPAAHLNLGIALRRQGRRAAAVREMRLAHRLEAKLTFRRASGGVSNRIE